MGISIFENKASDIFALSAPAAELTCAETTGEEFSRVFEGCVKECAVALKVEGNSEGVKADTLGGLVSPAVSTAKSTAEAMKAEGERAVVKGDTLGVLVSPAVSTVKSTAEAIKAEGGSAAVKADTLGGLVSSAVSIVKSTADATKAEGERAIVKVDTVGGLVNSAVSTVKSSGLEKSLEPDGKIEEESEVEIEEDEETGKSTGSCHASVLAGPFLQAEKSSPAVSPEKAAVNEAAVKSRKPGREGDKAAELSTQKPSAPAPEEKASAPGAEIVKTRYSFVREISNAVDSMNPAADTAVQEKKIAAPAENEAGKRDLLSIANDVSEKAGFKASSDARVLAGVNTPVVPVVTDEYSGAVVATELHETGFTAGSERAEVDAAAVKEHKDRPAPDLACVLPGEEFDAGGDTARPVAGNRENTPYLSLNPGGSDLPEGRDEKDGRKNEGGKTATVNGLSHGARHVNAEKFPVDAPGAKPVETVKPEAVFEKLSTGVRMSLARSNSEVSLRLTPEHLGSLHIRMSIEESSVKARIIVESEAAKTVLDSDSGKLREVFARQGLTLDRYTVELGPDSFSGSSTRFSENAAGENPYGDRSHRGSNGQRTDNTIETKPYRQSENTRRSSGGVDLFA